MFNLLDLYSMLKPADNPNIYTSYPVIIGATNSVASLDNGVWIINLVGSSPLTKSEAVLSKEGDQYFETQRSIISTSYQIDFYKMFDNANDTLFVVQEEAYKMREWLNSIEIANYLQALNAEILPTISTINFTSELSDTKSMLSRASFDFEIVSWQDVKIEVNVAKTAIIEKGVIL